MVPGDQVDMEVHHGLAGGLSAVHPDIVAVRVELFVQHRLRLVEQSGELDHLLLHCIEKIGDMPEGDQQQVAGADRVPVPLREPEPARRRDTLSSPPFVKPPDLDQVLALLDQMVDPLLIYIVRAGLFSGQGDGELLSEPVRGRISPF